MTATATATADSKDMTYKDVTEMSGDEISAEQLQRLCNRYYWAGEYAREKDVVEVACGTGAGLGYLQAVARSVQACDVAEEVLGAPRAHYGSRIRIDTADAVKLPYGDHSADVVLMFEAIYYLPDAAAFLREARRVLRPEGMVLIASANKDLYDFNPSPFSHAYYGAADFAALAESAGFTVAELAGGTPLKRVSLRQRVLRPVKRIVVHLGLMPKTTAGKKWMKRLVFGQMVRLPDEIGASTCPYEKPQPISGEGPNREYKVLFCAMRKKDGTN
ncbi:MAG: class I SAM-dependent methyltransferase [Rhodospirillales bacterium]|nr:class I SAM-dependent methyltransferase [Alphaproteobacteria bacterium]MCB9986254.1 class I SAM-dependent methyltransferase [Rhodospirillales bacterium]USO07191.1 MAG: class I SAM-dependent methyltransferase [Rhodospirillales bacterium]